MTALIIASYGSRPLQNRNSQRGSLFHAFIVGEDGGCLTLLRLSELDGIGGAEAVESSQVCRLRRDLRRHRKGADIPSVQ